MNENSFQPGTLWKEINEVFQRAVACCVLRRIQTEVHIIEEAGVRFQVRLVLNREGKAEIDLAKKRQTITRETATSPNPFCPCDERLLVADISPSHLCLLNKFTVIDNHVLLVTRVFEDQENALDRDDFTALVRCMAEFDGLGFYNGGREAGASQAHKHIQIIPLPLATNEWSIPIERLINKDRRLGMNDATRLPNLPFRHLFTRFRRIDGAEILDETAADLAARYRLMMKVSGLIRTESRGDRCQTAPYNLLITREWMLLIPRRQEYFDTLSLNALVFAGAILVRDLRELAAVRQHGPMQVLQSVAFPRTDYPIVHAEG